jgi:5-methylcytosine-specific restriction enzyme subunit McrC
VTKHSLIESVPTDLDLSLSEAQALSAAGRKLTPAIEPDELEGFEDEPTLIRCSMTPGGVWRVTVGDAMGIVAAGDLRLVVEPKIPISHLLYLFGRSELFPRIAPTAVAAASGADFWELVCRWLVEAVEHVIRRDLMRDYLPHRDELDAARGDIDAMATGDAYYRGRLRLVCDYEEFGTDTPLNRLVRAGVLAVAGSAEAAPPTRRRALRAAMRMEGIGPLLAHDLRVQIDRRTAHYRDAVLLARNALANARRSLDTGDAAAWSFLIRTPDLVEAGVREILKSALGESWDVRKQKIKLPGAGMTVAPDLIFGHVNAVADVKYKRSIAAWRRPDLYEVTTFAVASRTKQAAVIGFRSDGDPPPPPTAVVGETSVRVLTWDARETTAPDDAASELCEQVASWLGDSAMSVEAA